MRVTTYDPGDGPHEIEHPDGTQILPILCSDELRAAIEKDYDYFKGCQVIGLVPSASTPGTLELTLRSE